MSGAGIRVDPGPAASRFRASREREARDGLGAN